MALINNIVRLNNWGIKRRRATFGNDIPEGAIGRIQSITHSNPKLYGIIFNSHADKKYVKEIICSEGDFDILSNSTRPTQTWNYERVTFCIVPFWFIPVGLLMRQNNHWWYKTSTTQARSVEGYDCTFPPYQSLAIVEKEILEKNQYSKCLILNDNIYDEFEVSRNNPF